MTLRFEDEATARGNERARRRTVSTAPSMSGRRTAYRARSRSTTSSSDLVRRLRKSDHVVHVARPLPASSSPSCPSARCRASARHAPVRAPRAPRPTGAPSRSSTPSRSKTTASTVLTCARRTWPHPNGARRRIGLMTSYPTPKLILDKTLSATLARRVLSGLRLPVRGDGSRHARAAARPRSVALSGTADLARPRVRPPEVQNASSRGPRADRPRRVARAHARGGRGEPHVGRPAPPEAPLPGRAPADLECLPWRHEPRRAAAVAAPDGREPGREGHHVPQRVRRGLDRPGAGRERRDRVRRVRGARRRVRRALSPRGRLGARSQRPRAPLAHRRGHGEGRRLRF